MDGTHAYNCHPFTPAPLVRLALLPPVIAAIPTLMKSLLRASWKLIPGCGLIWKDVALGEPPREGIRNVAWRVSKKEMMSPLISKYKVKIKSFMHSTQKICLIWKTILLCTYSEGTVTRPSSFHLQEKKSPQKVENIQGKCIQGMFSDVWMVLYGYAHIHTNFLKQSQGKGTSHLDTQFQTQPLPTLIQWGTSDRSFPQLRNLALL